MKKISVVVPCYNASMYLHKCVDHLLHQTIGLENIEILLVDDASTDDGQTWEIITDYEKQYPDTIIAIHLEENLRQGGARNVGVSYAGGEYLIFCDSDDWLMKEALEHLYKAAREYNADVVEFLIKNINDHAIEITEVGKSETESTLFNLGGGSEQSKREFIITTNRCLSLGSQKKLFRTSLIKEHNIRFAQHVIFEEPSFMLPVRLYERRHYFLNEELYICFLSAGSTMRSDWGEHKWDNPKVWMHLINELKERELLNKYHDEIEYLFVAGYLQLTLRMLVQRGYEIQTDELKELQETVLKNFPHVNQNKYLNQNRKDGTWNDLLLKILDLEICDESVAILNRLIRRMLGIV